MASESIAALGSVADSTDEAGAYTAIADLGGGGRTTVYVDVSGAATLTVEFSDTGAFDGEESVVTADYDGATETYEQFGSYPRFVRAKVNQNLTALEIGQTGDVAGDNVRRWERGTRRADTIESDSVATGTADITNETFIEAERGSAQTGISSGTWTNLVDEANDDSRNEFTASAQFVPDESGKYDIIGVINIGVSAGDTVGIRVRDVDTGSTVNVRVLDDSVGSADPELSFSVVYPLTAGTTYEVQVTDFKSSFDVYKGSLVTIRRSVVHP